MQRIVHAEGIEGRRYRRKAQYDCRLEAGKQTASSGNYPPNARPLKRRRMMASNAPKMGPRQIQYWKPRDNFSLSAKFGIKKGGSGHRKTK
jgi:hypothetical protein